jgi:hypothetical protein
MLPRILLAFTIVCNFATLFGLWIAYEASPATLQGRIGHALLICGASASILAYIAFAVFVMRPNAHEAKAESHESEMVGATENDDTDYRELFLAENDARNKYQDKYTVAANKVLELQSIVSQPPTLRVKVISLCDELRCFLSKYGPIPSVARSANEESDEYVSRKWDVEDTWKSKMAADFRLNFEGRIETLRDEIQVVSGLRSYRIDTLMANAQTRSCNPDIVDNIRTELWTLAGSMTSN